MGERELTEDIRRTVRSFGTVHEPVGEFAWLAAYERALFDAESALTAVVRERDELALHLDHANAAAEELREACRVRRANEARLSRELDEARGLLREAVVWVEVLDPNAADDEAMRLWLADGKAPKGICPHCGSTVSVVSRGGFRARCSHRRCGASGPIMRTITRAVEAFCRPPGYVERHMGIHPSSLTDVVSVLEYDRDAAIRERDEARADAGLARGVAEFWSEKWTADVKDLTTTRREALEEAARVVFGARFEPRNADVRDRLREVEDAIRDLATKEPTDG